MSLNIDSVLQIDGSYYNKLDVESFALMLKSPSYCYKFYWLEALDKLISARKISYSFLQFVWN